MTIGKKLNHFVTDKIKLNNFSVLRKNVNV